MKCHTFDKPSHIALFVGGVIIVWVISLTVQNLNDETVYHVLLPGIITALPLFIWALIRQHTTSQTRQKRRHHRVSKTHRL